MGVFHCNLSACNYNQLSNSLQSFLADLNSAVVYTVSSIVSLISDSACFFFSNPMGAIPSKPTKTGITVTFMFHIFFHSLIILLLLLFTPVEFFTSASADGFSQVFEWQRVSSSLQNSSQYSGHSQQYCSLDGLHISTKFYVLQSL